MKALFNAVCAYCKLLKPRCAKCYHWNGNDALCGAPVYHNVSLCEDCRKSLKGLFKVDDCHKKGDEACSD